MECKYCKSPVPEERWNLGYQYCMAKNCQAESTDEWASGYVMMLVPKQAYAPVRITDPALKQGRSSGRV